MRAAELQLPWRGSPAGMAKAAIGCQRHVVGVVAQAMQGVFLAGPMVDALTPPNGITVTG